MTIYFHSLPVSELEQWFSDVCFASPTSGPVACPDPGGAIWYFEPATAYKKYVFWCRTTEKDPDQWLLTWMLPFFRNQVKKTKWQTILSSNRFRQSHFYLLVREVSTAIGYRWIRVRTSVYQQQQAVFFLAK